MVGNYPGTNIHQHAGNLWRINTDVPCRVTNTLVTYAEKNGKSTGTPRAVSVYFLDFDNYAKIR